MLRLTLSMPYIDYMFQRTPVPFRDRGKLSGYYRILNNQGISRVAELTPNRHTIQKHYLFNYLESSPRPACNVQIEGLERHRGVKYSKNYQLNRSRFPKEKSAVKKNSRHTAIPKAYEHPTDETRRRDHFQAFSINLSSCLH